MAAKNKMPDWKGDAVKPTMVFVGEEEVHDVILRPECPDPENQEISLHFEREAAEGPYASAYMNPTQALLLADRLRFAAFIAAGGKNPA